MVRMLLENYISGNNYFRFIDYAFQHSTMFSLTRNRFLEFENNNPRQTSFLTQLSPFKQGIINTKRWFYLSVGDDDCIIVDIYRTAKEAQDLLKQYYNDLYLGSRSGCKWMPEDICFFLDNSLWLGTSSHEEMCMVYPVSESMTQELYHFGSWCVQRIKNDTMQLDLSNFFMA